MNSGLLLMAVMGITFPAVLHFTHTEVHFGKSELSLSRFSSGIMLVAYASYLFFQLRSQHNLYDPLDGVRLPMEYMFLFIFVADEDASYLILPLFLNKCISLTFTIANAQLAN